MNTRKAANWGEMYCGQVDHNTSPLSLCYNTFIIKYNEAKSESNLFVAFLGFE